MKEIDGERMEISMRNIDELLSAAKLSELLSKKEQEDKSNKLVWGLAIIGAVAAVVGIAYAVYRYLTPDYLDDFDEEFDDDFDDDFFEEVEEENPVKTEE